MNNSINLEQSFNRFKQQFFMQNLKEEIRFNQGYLQCLTDLFKYLYEKTHNGTKDNVRAIEVLNEFIGHKTELKDAELAKINLLIPKTN